MNSDLTLSAQTLRLDKWLWFARVARTRSLAAKLCSEGGVMVGGREALKPHQAIRIGDVIDLPHQRRRLTVRALGERRGPAAEARQLYDEVVTPGLGRAEAPWISLFAEEEPSV
jgi:ribosome-associated heat shock protein Hsp15